MWAMKRTEITFVGNQKMRENTASGALYIAANCAAGLKRSEFVEVVDIVEQKKVRTRMLQFVDPNINPYINGKW